MNHEEQPIMRVLSVEDDALQRLEWERLLMSLGFECTSCADAEAAPEACRIGEYSIIVTDIGLPGMDGIEFCRTIRALPEGTQTRILIVSGQDAPETMQVAFQAGADEYLIKPVTPELLKKRMSRLCKQVEHDRGAVQYAGIPQVLLPVEKTVPPTNTGKNLQTLSNLTQHDVANLCIMIQIWFFLASFLL